MTPQQEEEFRKRMLQMGKPQEEIDRFLLMKRQETAQPVTQTTQPQPTNRELLGAAGKVVGQAKIAGVPLLPLAGAVVGGVAAGPIGAAALSGSAEMLRQRLAGEEENRGRVALETATAGLAPGAFNLLGRMVKGVGGKVLAPRLLRAGTKVVGEAAESGLNLNDVYMKWIPKIGAQFDEALGPIGKRLGKGKLGQFLTQAEGLIDDVAERVGNKFKIGPNVIKDALKKEAENIGDELGTGPAKQVAVDKILVQIEKKYGKGIGVKTAREILKKANKKFAEKILDITEKDAVSRTAQKIEGNTLRNVLRNKFPQIANALDTEQELLILKEVLTSARNKAIASGIDLSRISLTRPGTIINMILEQPGVSGRALTYGAKAGELGAFAKARVPLIGEFAEQYLPRTITAGGREEELPVEPGAVQFPAGGQAITQAPAETITPEGFILSEGKYYSQDRQWVFDEAQDDWVPNPEAGGLGGIPSKSEILNMMWQDLETTGGKNITKFKTIMDASYPEEEGLSTAQLKRKTILEQAAPVLQRVVEAAVQAPTGLKGAALSEFGRIPGVAGGQAEFLRRDIEGFARLIASAFASEVGVATDKDVQRWKSILPQPGDTMGERKRQAGKLIEQILSESETMGIDPPPAILEAIRVLYPELGLPTNINTVNF